MTKAYRIVRAIRHAMKAAVAMFAAVALPASAHTEPHRLPPTKPSVAPTADTAAATPVATVNAFHAALASGDTRAALGLLAEDVLIFESGSVERNRAEYADHHLGADAAFSAAVRRTLVSRAQREEGGSAWVTSVETVAGTYRGRAINSRSVETILLRKVGNDWRIAHIHWSSADIARK